LSGAFDEADGARQEGEEKDAAVMGWLVDQVVDRFTSGARILDVGCATGTLGSVLRARGHPGITGIDISEHAVEAARGAGYDRAILADIQESVPLADSCFDAIFALDVIEHLRRPFDGLQEMRRLLVPGGILILTTPNANSVLRPILGRRWALRDESHIFYFTRFTLGHLLATTGFRVERLVTRSYRYGPLGRLLSLAGSGGQLLALARKAGSSAPGQP
jgi:2-polyprenyl-3-methyl-5-hydroxy-6-metoxy-1,4-benzoquinol methylase